MRGPSARAHERPSPTDRSTVPHPATRAAAGGVRGTVDAEGQAKGRLTLLPCQADVAQKVIIKLLQLAQRTAFPPVDDHPADSCKGKGPLLGFSLVQDQFAHGNHSLVELIVCIQT